jgi:hypothetical protein
MVLNTLELTTQLNFLVKKGQALLLKHARKQILKDAFFYSVRWSVVGPLCLLLVVAANLWFGRPVWISSGTMLTLAFGITALVFLCRLFVLLGRVQVRRSSALALYDMQLQSADRLQAADEFLHKPELSTFEWAAVADSAALIQRASIHHLDPLIFAGRPTTARQFALPLLIATAFVTVTLWFNPQNEVVSFVEVPDGQISALSLGSADEQHNEDSAVKRDNTELLTHKVSEHSLKVAEVLSQQSALQSESSEKSAATAGSTDEQRAMQSQQQAQRGAGASAQSSATVQQPAKSKAAGVPKSDQWPDQEQQVPQAQKANSGVSNGAGNSSGSKPASSEKEAADNKAESEDENLLDQDPEHEEDEEQKADSAAQAKASSRKAAVDRRLSASAGSKDVREQANGRSGPGGQKKTRGVAAMLLAVPMPDRLQGTPNPGRTKSIQEQSRPEPDLSGLAAVSDRGSNQATLGTVTQQSDPVWLQQVVRTYFMAGKVKTQAPQKNITESEE